MTAEEFLNNKDTFDENYPTISLHDAEEAMIEFAKYHVVKALKVQAKLAKRYIINNKHVPSSTVLNNAYPLENIK